MLLSNGIDEKNSVGIETEFVSDAEFAALSAAISAAENAISPHRFPPFSCDLHLWKVPGTFVTRARPVLPQIVADALRPLTLQPSPSCALATTLLCFPLAAHDVICDIIAQFTARDAVSPVPLSVRELAQRIATRLEFEQAGLSDEYVRLKVGDYLWERLLPFQREGVLRAVQTGGRVLLADDMGMGKTVQALAIAEYYRDAHTTIDALSEECNNNRSNAPVLILCPSTLRAAWVSAVSKWLPHVPSTSVHCISSAKDARRLVTKQSRGMRDVWDNIPDVRFVVCSYDVVPRALGELAQMADNPANSKMQSTLPDWLHMPPEDSNESHGLSLSFHRAAVPPEMTFSIVIADECHCLKSCCSARTMACLPVILAAEYRILISGTPVTSRPVEIFPQLQALLGGGPLDPPFMPPIVFSERYCGGSTRGERGATHLYELNAILSMVMVRRVKSEVLDDLPPKVRNHCLVELADQRLKKFQDMFGELECLRVQISDPSVSPTDWTDLKRRSHALYSTLYSHTASAKVPAVVTRLRQLLEEGGSTPKKILVFGQHRIMLNAVQAFLVRSNIQHVLMDGATPPERRIDLVKEFQNDCRIKVAVLSIKVAGIGLTLTAANWILFAELDWVPSNLVQAEDRAHRIGRSGVLHVEYVVAKGTLDDCLWPVLKRKLAIIGQTMDAKLSYHNGLDPVSVSAELANSDVAVQATFLAAQNKDFFDHDDTKAYSEADLMFK
jgi:SWI/SNF-related matrix-associated actin-dependent regulator of chromatin subfamily A-like protein 1